MGKRKTAGLFDVDDLRDTLPPNRRTADPSLGRLRGAQAMRYIQPFSDSGRADASATFVATPLSQRAKRVPPDPDISKKEVTASVSMRPAAAHGQ